MLFLKSGKKPWKYVWRTSFLFNLRPPACNFTTKWTHLHVFLKGFACILMNLLWFLTFFRKTFCRKPCISNCSFWNSEDIPSLFYGIFYFVSGYIVDPFVNPLEEVVSDRKKKGRHPRRIQYDIHCRWALCLLVSFQPFHHVIVRVLLSSYF